MQKIMLVFFVFSFCYVNAGCVTSTGPTTYTVDTSSKFDTESKRQITCDEYRHGVDKFSERNYKAYENLKSKGVRLWSPCDECESDPSTES